MSKRNFNGFVSNFKLEMALKDLHFVHVKPIPYLIDDE